MLKGSLVHPQILEALGKAGHGSKILIADGNYPKSTTQGRNATVVYLNLAPGLVNCVQVLEALITATPIECAAVMDPQGSAPRPPIWDEFIKVLAKADYKKDLELIDRLSFYSKARTDDVCLVIATGLMTANAYID